MIHPCKKEGKRGLLNHLQHGFSHKGTYTCMPNPVLDGKDAAGTSSIIWSGARWTIHQVWCQKRCNKKRPCELVSASRDAASKAPKNEKTTPTETPLSKVRSNAATFNNIKFCMSSKSCSPIVMLVRQTWTRHAVYRCLQSLCYR